MFLDHIASTVVKMAAAPSQAAVGPEDSAFAPITHDNHGGILIIVAALLMIGTLMALGIRIHVRMSVTKGLGVDDYVATAASVLAWFLSSLTLAVTKESQVLAVGQTVATLVSVSHGFGKVMDLIQDKADSIPQIEKVRSLFALLICITDPMSAM